MTGDAPAAVTVATPGSDPPPGPRSKRIRHGWILETLGFVAVYQLYDWLRTQTTGTFDVALRNAKDIVAAEKFLGIYWEHAIQQPFLNADWFMAFWNIYYGTVHFVVPVVALVVMYRKAPARYVRWRNTLIIMFGLACLCFAVYPLNPPRLMPDPPYKFVDTSAEYFNFGPQTKNEFTANGVPTKHTIEQFGNPYAAMPSFHVGWSTWSVLALWPLVRRRWIKALLALYPLTIIFCIVVTANHWILDAVGGWIVLGVGYAAALGLERATRAIRARGIRARGIRAGRRPAADAGTASLRSGA
jgi:membrane-associated phospholipid phosphatase